MSKSNIETEDEKHKTKLSKISKNEKIFWFSIFVLILLFSLLSLLANLGQRELSAKNAITMSLVSSNKHKINLENANEELKNSLDAKMLDIDSVIDKEVDGFFEPIIKYQVDVFLDFHYSVKGEYTELFTMAKGYVNKDNRANKLIEQKLLGANFKDDFSKSLDTIDTRYKDAIEEHYAFMDLMVFSGVDMEDNSNAMDMLAQDIETNMITQSIKGGILALHFAPKIVTALGAKILTKGGGKVVAKSAVKMAGIGGGATAGAATGLVCGPFAWLCSPLGAVVGAGAAWLATDAVVVNADEMLNRDEFKKEIIISLTEAKQRLKLRLQKEYNQGLILADQKMQKMLQDTQIVEKQIIMDKIIENLSPQQEIK